MRLSDRRRSLPSIRSGLRRHGLVRRPAALRKLIESRSVRFTDGNAVELFETGAAGLEAMLDTLRRAERFAHVETYTFRSDATGSRFLAALTERARAGCEVRVLYDAVGSRGIDPEAFRELRAAGGYVHVFNPLSRIYPRFAPRRRDHRKLLVVDGEIGFVGGLNIGDEYAFGLGADDGVWRDAHVRVRGPIVRDLEAVFLESWFRADGPGQPWQSPIIPASAAGAERCAVLADGPVYRRRRVRDLMVSALDGAEREVQIASPYFAPGRRLLDAIAAAARRGVTVDLLLAGRTDHPALRRASRAFLPRLLKRGVRVHEYAAAMMHAKVAVFDRTWAVLGTSNLDRQSLEHSFEVNLVLESQPIARELADSIERDIAVSQPLDLAVLGARPAAERLLDWLASWLLYFI